MQTFNLYTWPESQTVMRRKGATLIIPPEGEELELDSAYMVPEKKGQYAYVDFPDSQNFEDEEGVLSAYDLSGLFVPVEMLN